MKKKNLIILAVINFIIVFALLIDNSGYVEFNEIIMLAISFVFFVILIESINSKRRFKFVNNTLIYIAYLIIIMLADLTVDHFIFSFKDIVYDGRPLTLLEEIAEYKDDMLVITLYIIVPYIILYFIVYTIKFFNKKN